MNLANISQTPLSVLLSLVGLLFLSLGMRAGQQGAAGMALGAAFVLPILFQFWLSRLVAAEISLLVTGAIMSLIATVKLSSMTR